MSDLAISDLRKTFGDVVALDGVSLSAADGELLTLLGPSGCGKSTTLWSIAGLHEPDSGTIRVGGETFFDGRTSRPVEDRNCGVVFQSYAVWPHMSVADNVGYPLKLRRVRGAERRRRVQDVLELVELPQYADRYPHQLSGGQQQRVALARALAYEPQLLLLDEPFSNLDAKLRERARDWLRALQRRIGVTTVFVTHDQDEALSMSDRIAVMNGGRLLQVGTPEDVYRRPAALFVADFLGTVNVLPGELSGGDGTTATVRLAHAAQTIRVATTLRRAGPIDVAVRPEALVLHREAPPAGTDNVLPGRVVDRSYLGDHYRLRVEAAGAVLTLACRHDDVAEHVFIEIPATEARLLPRDAAAASNDKEQNDVPTA